MNAITPITVPLTSSLMLLCAACAGSDATSQTPSKAEAKPQAETGTTVKSGASLQFSHALRDAVAPGDDGMVTLTVREGYDSGTMTLEASAKDGLDIYANSRSTQFSLSGPSQHVWDIYFTAGTEGVSYIDVIATVQNGTQATGARAYSIPVQVGDSTARKNNDQGLQTKQTEDGAVIIMEAEETIID